MTAGLTFRTEARTLTEVDLVNFVTLAGFTEPLFLDHREAARKGYPARIVPGALTFAVAEGLVMQCNLLHRTGIAVMRIEIELRAPVYLGNTIEVVVEVTEARASSSRPSAGIVTSRNTVLDQDGRAVLVYSPTRLVEGAATS